MVAKVPSTPAAVPSHQLAGCLMAAQIHPSQLHLYCSSCNNLSITLPCSQLCTRAGAVWSTQVKTSGCTAPATFLIGPCADGFDFQLKRPHTKWQIHTQGCRPLHLTPTLRQQQRAFPPSRLPGHRLVSPLRLHGSSAPPVATCSLASLHRGWC